MAKEGNEAGFCGLYVVRIRLLLSFTVNDSSYHCALVSWFKPIGDEPDKGTGMWIVEPEEDDEGKPLYSIISLDTIVRAAHLLPHPGSTIIPRGIASEHTLDVFSAYYVNKYIDYHAHETLMP